MKKDSFGVWECVVPAIAGKPAIPHNSKIKVHLALSLDISFALGVTDSSLVQISMTTPSGERIERLPAWAKYVPLSLPLPPRAAQ